MQSRRHGNELGFRASSDHPHADGTIHSLSASAGAGHDAEWRHWAGGDGGPTFPETRIESSLQRILAVHRALRVGGLVPVGSTASVESRGTVLVPADPAGHTSAIAGVFSRSGGGGVPLDSRAAAHRVAACPWLDHRLWLCLARRRFLYAEPHEAVRLDLYLRG